MPSSFARETSAGLATDELPGYARMLEAYHRSRAAELRGIIATLPLGPDSRVLDVACGDGCYSHWLAERAGQVIGVDLCAAYLDLAVRPTTAAEYTKRISFGRADAARLPFIDGSFDLVWCAQSFFSLPDPLATLREMVRVTQPAGHIAILENDTLHQILLPWPAGLELAVRSAQFQALAAEYGMWAVDKFYIGRNLCSLFRECGIKRCEMHTFPIERRAPLSSDEELFLCLYFAELREGAWPYLDAAAQAAFDRLFDPCSASYLLRQPDFQLTHLETLAIGQRPGAVQDARGSVIFADPSAGKEP
jgi:ubiquinone/menaquinone biosynthesis C-methylase UbiE